jgi:hypothetical protein
MNSLIALTLICLLTTLPACSATRARKQLAQRQAEFQRNNEAWNAAKYRLWSMCPDPPKTEGDYWKKVQIKNTGKDPSQGCDLRLVKLTNGPTLDDWNWNWLPGYQTIVNVHEEELRKRVKPKLYEEYMLALSHHLAKRADSGEITPEQFKQAFNEGWKWLISEMQKEQILLQQKITAAEQRDVATLNTLNTIAAGLATVATAAIVASAVVSASRPSATNCYAYSAGGGNYQVQCY